eukprot:TRINITY_DN8892_c0_g1_i1.p1 TRINITY_DN8892_c0_g1~~TRINITY_DN8892_c0_g1_i1.p1  ORF type:complete len:274 (-),score=6.29 TRINITY_DN8892_c0_g1_i1:136-957(-)
MHTDEDGAGVPQERFEALGITFDLDQKKIAMASSWVTKLVGSPAWEEVKGGTASVRTIFRVFGAIVWHSFALSCPLCTCSATLAFIRRLASRAAAGDIGWDSNTEVPPAVLGELHARVSLVEENVPLTPSAYAAQQCEDTETVWTDASSTMWGYILESCAGFANQGVFEGSWAEYHIFIKELATVGEALEELATRCRGASVHLHIDNAAVVACLNKGLSSNFVANEMLSRIFSLAKDAHFWLRPRWVPTDAQKADGITRSVILPQTFPPRFIL